METWFPPKPQTLEQAKVSAYFIRDSILKTLYIQGVTRGFEFAELLKLPFSLVEPEIRHLQQNLLVVPVGGAGVGGANGIDYGLSKDGREHAQETFHRGRYLGPAPVTLEDFRLAVSRQRLVTRGIRRAHLERAFQDIVISPEAIDHLGPALGSGGPIFIYGKPGNGKTHVTEHMTRLFRQPIFVPYAVQVDGQIIQIFDEKVHLPIAPAALPEGHPVGGAESSAVDGRWVCVHRPFVIVGGELTIEMLDLIYHEGQNAYEAPFQLKACCGTLLVDDFGRQIVKPKDFLNRWIFPLEKGSDFLTLANGKKIEVPFDLMLIFSTNLHPKELADEAFWRRIKYKIEMPGPSEADFLKLFQGVCERSKIAFDSQAFEYLVAQYYREPKRELRAVHPRDLVGHMRDQIQYAGFEPKLSRDLIDRACRLYFSSVDPRINEAWKA